MFKWPWSKSATRQPSCSSMKDGWRIAAEPYDGMSFSDMVADLKSWGFEVCRKGNVQDIYHEGAGVGLRNQSNNLDDVLSNIYWGIRAGRESAARDLEPEVDSTLAELSSAQRGRQVAIDLLTAHIGSERRGLEELMRDNPGSSLWPGWKSDIEKLEQILERVVRA